MVRPSAVWGSARDYGPLRGRYPCLKTLRFPRELLEAGIRVTHLKYEVLGQEFGASKFPVWGQHVVSFLKSAVASR